MLMRLFLPLLAFIFGAAWPVSAQISANTIEQRLKSIDPKTLSNADCTSQVARAATANAPELIYGGRVCEVVGQPVESSFLFAVGQLRALSDILLLPPATKSGDQSLMGLYVMLYYGGGMTGIEDEVLRDPITRERFLKLLNDWLPAYSSTYDPGWQSRKRPDAAKYEATVAQAKVDLRSQLDRTIRLVSDNDYYSLHRQYMQLLERHPDGISADTPEGRRADELQSRKRERMIALGVDPGPLPAEAEKQLAETRENFPSATPTKDEVMSAGNQATVERCRDLAERSAVSQGGEIARVLVTSNQKWGTILRADIAGGDDPLTRFTCTERTTSSTPMDIGGETIPPLPVATDKPK